MFLQKMNENLHGIKIKMVLIPIQQESPIHSLLNFLFLGTLPVPQFTVLNSQILGTYFLLSALSILTFTES